MMLISFDKENMFITLIFWDIWFTDYNFPDLYSSVNSFIFFYDKDEVIQKDKEDCEEEDK